MKRVFIISIIFTICGLFAMAQNSSGMAHTTTGKDHIDVFYNIQKPSVSYDNGSEKILIFNGKGQYHAVVTFISTQAVVFDMIIDGEDDEIPLEGQDNGNYMLALTGQNGVTYRWTIDKGGNDQIVPYVGNGASNRIDSFWHQLFEY